MTMRPLSEQTILITGATDGLGKALAAELAAAGASLLLHGRDDARGEATIAEVAAATGNDRLTWHRADFASLAEVRALGRGIGAEVERVDGLVNNAGIGTTLPGGGERMESEDGHELRFQVNYLSGFLLTCLLEPLLVRSAPARVVNVSSAGQMPIDFDDVMLERGYSGVRAYCQSKLAQAMFTIDEAARLRSHGVTVNCLHPATYMPTKMVLHARGRAASTLEEGVEATMRLICDPALDGVTGLYFDGTTEAAAERQAYDAEARRRLWELSERLTGLGAP
jgi:NAD(P)-dependent dehydrogenase (short-subunit alcohol dehydrogenase family)